MSKKILYIFLLFISIKAVGQRTTSSPYSFFGIGQEYRSQTVEQASMGGVGLAFGNTYQLNLMNPAANADLLYSTFSFGAAFNQLSISDATSSQNSQSFSLSYFNLGFPVGNNAGFNFGIQPNTNMGYSLINFELDGTGEATSATRFYGLGGTSRIYGSFGMYVLKGLSLGLEAGYTFGKIENSVLNQRADVFLATNNREVTNITGAGVKLGLMYRKALDNNLILNFGATVKLDQNLSTKGEGHLYSLYLEPDGSESPRDTISSTVINGTIKSPVKTGIGFGLGKNNKWYVGVDYETQAAFDVQGALLGSSSNYKYGNSNRFSIGGFYTPKENSITNYWDRVTYRAGLRVEDTGLLVNGGTTTTDFTAIKDFGISFGLGLPLKGLSNVNVGFEYGQKGTTVNGLLKENYFNFRLSLSLNDKWFQKSKID
ncbi:membrane protein [Polaribacter pacificus]|uniref:Membrane protein n=1 Tax=Polaribacter pacificus TaxID=1775173 RepID=A0A917MDU8_9FLAO|nr:hypothetical protein [Polaribacter pacificus]GGG96885.1 membrane protein [Polaribacter pacificus]